MCARVCWLVQGLQQLQQQLSEATTKLREYAAADGLIDRAITTAVSAGELLARQLCWSVAELHLLQHARTGQQQVLLC